MHVFLALKKSSLRRMPTAWLMAAAAACGAPDESQDNSAQRWMLGSQVAAVHEAPEPGDLVGRWGVRVQIPVSWRNSYGLKAGDDILTNYLIMDLSEEGELSTRYSMCGMELPATSSASMLGRPTERYQLKPDLAAFDGNQPPATVTDRPTVSVGEGGPSLATNALAFQVGVALDDPLTCSWPRDIDALSRMGRLVAFPGSLSAGMPTRPRTGLNFVLPPTSLTSRTRLSFIYLAVRNVIRMNMTFSSPYVGAGSVVAQTYRHDNEERPMLDSLILGGISLDSAGKAKACSKSTLRTINSNTPTLMAEQGDLALVRLPEGAGCAEARQANYQ